jgi:hypothetical protein
MLTDTALGDALKSSMAKPGKYVEIRAELYEKRGGSQNKCSADDSAASPRIKGFGVTYTCAPGGPG